MNGLYFWSQCILVHSNVVLWNFCRLVFFTATGLFSRGNCVVKGATSDSHAYPSRPARERTHDDLPDCLLSYHKINMLDNAFTNEQWHESKVGGC